MSVKQRRVTEKHLHTHYCTLVHANVNSKQDGLSCSLSANIETAAYNAKYISY